LHSHSLLPHPTLALTLFPLPCLLQEIIYVRFPTAPKPITESLRGIRWSVEFLDILPVDVTCSKDKKSFDARAILRSTYHQAFLERGLASLPEPVEEEPEPAPPQPLGAGRVRRAAGAVPPAAPEPPQPVSLHTHDLVVGPGQNQIYPSRLVTTSLDGASVNMGETGGVAALLKKEVPHVKGVHGVAHVVELAWADGLKGELLIDEMLETNQMGYVHYAGSGKKKLTYGVSCTALGEEQYELVSLHGIRWRESSHRAAKNLLLSWHARTTDLLEEASVEIGLKLTPLSLPEAFIGLLFHKKTNAGDYGTGDKVFVLKVIKPLGKTADGVNTFQAKYMRVLNGRACRGEIETFNQGSLLSCLLDASDQRERLMATKAGILLKRLTRYSYVKTLAYWVDVTAEGKVVSKLFQRNGLLLSDITSGVEDSVSAIDALKTTPGAFMTGLVADFDLPSSDQITHGQQALRGRDLTDVASGEEAYTQMLSNVTASIVDHMNERFYSILKDEVLKASCVFEHVRWPIFASDRLGLEAYGEDKIELLLDHYKVLFNYLGGDASRARREWRKLKLLVGRSDTLTSLSYLELYQRLFDQKGNKFVYMGDGTVSDQLDDQSLYNILLVLAIVMSYAVDTSVCERGFALMNHLKTARRSLMGNLLLRTLMTICELGAEWDDPSKIPVDEIAKEWRSQSKRGRYESAMWRAAGLEEPNSNKARDPRGAAGNEDVEGEVDNATAGGFFQWMGRDPTGRPTVIPPHRPGPESPAESESEAEAEAEAEAGSSSGSDDSDS
jgi:hypothetical protein